MIYRLYNIALITLLYLGVYDATYDRSGCSPNGWSHDPANLDEESSEDGWSEDCLYLTIYVPKRAHEAGRKVPVGVWFHGGAFSGGAGSIILYDGRNWAHETDMVLVTVNYRCTLKSRVRIKIFYYWYYLN